MSSSCTKMNPFNTLSGLRRHLFTELDRMKTACKPSGVSLTIAFRAYDHIASHPSSSTSMTWQSCIAAFSRTQGCHFKDMWNRTNTRKRSKRSSRNSRFNMIYLFSLNYLSEAVMGTTKRQNYQRHHRHRAITILHAQQRD